MKWAATKYPGSASGVGVLGMSRLLVDVTLLLLRSATAAAFTTAEGCHVVMLLSGVLYVICVRERQGTALQHVLRQQVPAHVQVGLSEQHVTCFSYEDYNGHLGRLSLAGCLVLAVHQVPSGSTMFIVPSGVESTHQGLGTGHPWSFLAVAVCVAADAIGVGAEVANQPMMRVGCRVSLITSTACLTIDR